jgi:hypothetical protein
MASQRDDPPVTLALRRDDPFISRDEPYGFGRDGPLRSGRRPT